MAQDPQNASKRVFTDDINASNLASNAPVASAIEPDIASQLRSVAMRARRNVSQGYATNRDPLQPGGPSSRTKSLSTNSIFRSSNDIMHDVFAPSNDGDPGPFPTQSSKKRARSEEVDTDLSTSSPADAPQKTDGDTIMTLDSRLADRPIKPLRKSGKVGLHTRSLPASLWPTGSVETRNVEEEEDWSTAMDGESKPYEPMELS